jgi:ABC-type lipoprotein release transport system permease subunit
VHLELRLAWRNVWRNPRRTGLTVAATVFAVYLVAVFVAMAAGLHEKMIEDSVRVHSGHLALAGKGYFEDETLEHWVRFDPELARLLRDSPGIRGYAPRVLGFGLLSKDSATHGVAVLGVDPPLERTVSTLETRLERGSFVGNRPREIVLGTRLAHNLSAEIGDELLLYSVAYSLETAYELFRVAGIVSLPEPNLDRSVALISLSDAQAFFVYGDRVSEVAILAANADAAPAVARALLDRLAAREGEPAEVMLWSERMPELVQLIFLDDAGLYIMLAILVIVVGFGILNTILMAVLERTRELGVMLALGLRPAALFRVIYYESMLLAALGLVIGLALALPSILYLEAHPIPLTGQAAGAMELFGVEPVFTFLLKPLNPIGSMLTILGVAALAALYPAQKASRARPVDALRSL